MVHQLKILDTSVSTSPVTMASGTLRTLGFFAAPSASQADRKRIGNRHRLGYDTQVKHPGLLNDILFKIVFGSRDSEPVLRALLNALLNRTDSETLVALEILNPGFDKEYLAEKGAILDVKARDQAGRQFNIEVQMQPVRFSTRPSFSATSWSAASPMKV